MVKVKTNNVAIKKNPIAEFFISYPAVAIIAILIVVFSFLSPTFLTVGTFQIAMKGNAYLLIAAIAETLVIMTGGIDLSVSTVMAFSAVLACLYMDVAGAGAASIIVGLLIALAIGTIFGIFNGVFVGYFGMQPFIVTMGTRLIALGIAKALTKSVAVSGPEAIVMFGFEKTFGIPTVFIFSMIVLIIMAVIVKQSRWGRELILFGANKDSARYCGIDARRVEASAYAVSGILSGLAGFFTIIVLGVGQPTIGDSNLLIIIGGVVLGGTSMEGGEGSVARTFIGIALLALLTAGLNAVVVPYTTQMIIEGLIIFIGYGLSVNVTAKSSSAVK
ncbi:MAG: ABC transporter permease [Eubacteriales bacterium]